jgi:hypothetical protein
VSQDSAGGFEAHPVSSRARHRVSARRSRANLTIHKPREHADLGSSDHATLIGWGALPSSFVHVEVAVIRARAVQVIHAGIQRRMAVRSVDWTMPSAVPAHGRRTVTVWTTTAIGVALAVADSQTPGSGVRRAITHLSGVTIGVGRTLIIGAIEHACRHSRAIDALPIDAIGTISVLSATAEVRIRVVCGLCR